MGNNEQLPTRRPGLWFVWLIAVTMFCGALLCSERTQALLWQTGKLAAATILIAVPVGSLLAWLIVRSDIPLRRFLGGVLLMTVAVPLCLQAAAWNAGFGQQGWLQLWKSGLGSEPLLFGFRGAAIVHGLAAIPWVALIVGTELSLSQRDYEDAALLDGSQRQVLLNITIPQIAVAAGTAMLWIVVTVAGEITVTDLYQVRTYAEEIYVGFAIDTLEGESTVAPAIMGALPGILMLTGLTLSVLFIGQKFWFRPTCDEHSEPRPVPLRRWKWPAFLFVLVALIILIDIPLLNLFYKCGATVEQSVACKARGWSLTKAVSLITAAPISFRQEIGWSLAIAQLSSLVALAVAVPIAWWIRSSWQVSKSMSTISWRSLLMGTLAAVLWAIPGPLLALGVVRLFQISDSAFIGWLYSQSIAAPVIVLTLKCWPLVMLLVWHGLATVTPESTESARLAGAGFWRQLGSVVIPQRKAILLCAWLVGVIIALGDVAASILTVPPGVTTVAIRIFGLMHYGVEDQLAAICLAMVGVIAILAYLVGVLWQLQATMNMATTLATTQTDASRTEE